MPRHPPGVAGDEPDVAGPKNPKNSKKNLFFFRIPRDVVKTRMNDEIIFTGGVGFFGPETSFSTL